MDQKIKIMSEEKVSVALLRFGLPATIGLFVIAIYNFVDAIFVGGLGTSAMGAAAISFPIAMVIIGLGLTLGSGAASYISRLLGARDNEKANKVASTAIFSSIVLGILVIIPSLIHMDYILKLFGATDTILPYAKNYAYVFIGGSILNVINVTLNNLMRAEGAAKTSMKAIIIGSLLNIVLDPIFIYTFGMGIKGAAVATVISQSTSTLLLVKFFLSGKSILNISIKKISFSKDVLIEIFKIGMPNLVFQLLSSASIGMINSASAPYGDEVVAAMGIVNRIFAMGSFVIFGFFKGFQPLAGYNFGAKNFDRLRELKNTALRWTSLFCFIVAIAQILFAQSIIGIFSDNPVVLDIGIRGLRAYSIMFPFFGFQTMYMTLFLSIGKAREGAALSLGRQGIFFIPTILILPNIIGINGIIFSQFVADTFTILMTIVFAIRLKKTLFLQANENFTSA